MTPYEFHYHHAGLSVADLDESIQWYGDKLGFSLEKRHPVPTIPAEVAIVVNGDVRVELFCVPGALPLPDDRRVPNRDLQTHGNKHVAFVVPDVMVLADILSQRGVDVVLAHRFEFGAFMFIRDNTGNLIEFIEGPAPTGSVARL